MTALADLLARVEKMAGPDREIDAALHALARPDDFDDADEADWYLNFRGANNASRYHFDLIGIPRYTGTVDGALRFCKTVLPQHVGRIGFGAGNGEAQIWRLSEMPVNAVGHSPALALVAAVLKALVAKEVT